MIFTIETFDRVTIEKIEETLNIIIPTPPNSN